MHWARGVAHHLEQPIVAMSRALGILGVWEQGVLFDIHPHAGTPPPTSLLFLVPSLHLILLLWPSPG